MPSTGHYSMPMGVQDKALYANSAGSLFEPSHMPSDPYGLYHQEEQIRNFELGQKTSIDIFKSGDFGEKVYLQFDLGTLNSGNGGAGVHYVDGVGVRIVEEARVKVGAMDVHTIDPYSILLDEELNVDPRRSMKKWMGLEGDASALEDRAMEVQRIIVPLPVFWAPSGLAATSVGNAYNIVGTTLSVPSIEFTVAAKADLINTAGGYPIADADAALSNVKLVARHVFVTDEERAQLTYAAKHEEKTYVVQFLKQLTASTVAANAVDAQIEFSGNLPASELIFFARTAANTTAKQWFNFAGVETGVIKDEPFKTAQLVLGGQDKTDVLGPEAFGVLWQHGREGNIIDRAGVKGYAFSLSPFHPDHNGGYNLGRVVRNSIKMTFTASSGSRKVYVYGRLRQVLKSRGYMLYAAFSH